MEYVFIGIIIFLFLLAVFDLSVGVSNDAVNFLNSAVGARAARFKTVIIIAALGVFIGAVMSNGMMDIARHGIFRPEQFSFYDLICIFMAVMVTDIILLDVFNSLGMPTSTTVSMVFELLGATFAVSLFKLASDHTGLSLADLLNTEKALSVIIGIFLSVAIAFVFGALVQYLSRLWFTFNYKKNLGWKIGLFGGLSITAIVYFLLIKGTKDLSFMTPDVKQWVKDNTLWLLGACMVGFTGLMQMLYWLKVNVFKVIVLTGTFALAMAFAGNDLVNFIGVPLTGFDSFRDFVANGNGDPKAFLMGSLNGAASTPIYFLIGAGIIMIVALATSKKARKVVNTSVNLSRQDGGDEMFGSSRIARRLVRLSLGVSQWVVNHTPENVRRWTARRLDTTETIMEHGAAFDLVRGSINLVLAGALIALGTSLKLPLSTTYVTFMVAMGTSLADRAWGRESAVFRITGVISVIGGWFITAGVAFIGAALIVSLMHLGGTTVIVLTAIVAIFILVRSNLRRKKEEETTATTLFESIISAEDPQKAWPLLKLYMMDNEHKFLEYALAAQQEVTRAFMADDAKALDRQVTSLGRHKAILKDLRRRSTLCLRQMSPDVAIEKSAWFHSINNCQLAMLYNLLRIAEACHDHVDNNFRPLDAEVSAKARPICGQVSEVIGSAIELLGVGAMMVDPTLVDNLRRRCDKVKDAIALECRRIYTLLHDTDTAHMAVLYVYLNMMQEQQELVSNLRKMLRADLKLLAAPQTEVATYAAQAS
ncbi:MAG: inorganic phosphate transporter [Bacteroidales bacterium]|nr:inorganic phosphate transporter [Bacteroidales bacterium]